MKQGDLKVFLGVEWLCGTPQQMSHGKYACQVCARLFSRGGMQKHWAAEVHKNPTLQDKYPDFTNNTGVLCSAPDCDALFVNRVNWIAHYKKCQSPPTMSPGQKKYPKFVKEVIDQYKI